MRLEQLFHSSVSPFRYFISTRRVLLRVKMSSEDKESQVFVRYNLKYSFFKEQFEVKLHQILDDGRSSYFEVELELDDPRVAYYFLIIDRDGNEYTLFEDGGRKMEDSAELTNMHFQIPYINEIDINTPIEWRRNAIGYLLFVDKFYKGGSESKTKLAKENAQRGIFPTGDTRGVQEKIPELKDLGVNLLLLCPSHIDDLELPHDAFAYYHISKTQGLNKDLFSLCAEIHKNDMRVVFELTPDHINAKNPVFLEVLNKGVKSKYTDWFIKTGVNVVTGETKYAMYQELTNMPKLNTSNEEVQTFLISLYSFYVATYKLDGLRLDAVEETSLDFIREFNKAIKKINNQCLLAGDHFFRNLNFFDKKSLDGGYNYPLIKILYYYFAGNYGEDNLCNSLNNLLSQYSTMTNETLYNLVDTHDTPRFYSYFGEDLNKLILAQALVFSYIGIPVIYMGDEVPVKGMDVSTNRSQFPWNELDRKSYYFELLQTLCKIKKEHYSKYDYIKIIYEDNLLKIVRNSEMHQIVFALTMNKVKVKMHGDEVILLEHNFNDGVLNNGFIVYKVNLF